MKQQYAITFSHSDYASLCWAIEETHQMVGRCKGVEGLRMMYLSCGIAGEKGHYGAIFHASSAPEEVANAVA